MKKTLLSLTIFFSAVLSLYAQNFFSDSLRISLLTCGPGEISYERFGHTAVHIKDLKQPDIDIVFNYGIFSFNEPNFIYRFVKGETDYQLGAENYSFFLNQYRRSGRLVFEQVLDIDQAQAADIASALIVNYQPENRVYRYNFLYDNCATRPFHLINHSCDNAIRYDSTWVNPSTYRQLVKEKTGSGTWTDFGITLALGMNADKSTTLSQQVFRPDLLADAFANAKIDGHPLIVQTDTLLQAHPDLEKALNAPRGASDPLPLLTLILALSVMLLAYRIKQNRENAKHERTARLASNIFDTFFFLVTGITAAILWFLLLGSEHPTVNENLNCLWLWPTNILFCLLIWTKTPQKVHRIYFLINFAALLIYITCATSGWQESSPEVLLLAASLMFRDIERALFNQKEISQ